jgi:phospholipase C
MPHGAKVCAAPTAGNVSPDDPNHSVTGVAFQLFSTFHPDESLPAAKVMEAETMLGFLQEQEQAIGTTNLTRAGESITFASTALIPVYNAIAQNFLIFDKWFADVPGPTDPNRYFLSNSALRS